MRRRASAASITFLALCLIALGLALEVRHAARTTRDEVRRAADGRAVNGMARDLGALLTTAGQLRRTTDLLGVRRARRGFPALAAQTIAMPVATSVALEQVVLPGRRKAFEEATGLRIGRPTGARADIPSLVVTSAVSSQVVSSSLWGLDVFVDPSRRRTLREAAAAGAPRATPPVSGLRRLDVGLSVYLPLARRPGMPIPDAVGISLSLRRLGDHLRTSLPAGTEVAISDSGRTIVQTAGRARQGATRPFSFAGRPWTLSASVPSEGVGRLWLSVLAGGVVAAALLAVLVWGVLARLARTSAERELLAERVGELFAHSPLGLLLTDADHRVVEVNPALEALLRTRGPDLLGRPVLDLLHAEDRERMRLAAVEMSAGAEAVPAAELRLRRDDGTIVWTQLIASPQRSADGSLTGVLLQVHDIEQRRREHAALQQLAERDPLTGTLNRRSFDARLQAHLGRCATGASGGALFMVDLDRFKEVNDVHGHGVGDRVLVAVAGALAACLRDGDALGRLGGDEFAVLLADGAAPADFDAVADRLVRALDDVAVDVPGTAVRPSASIGWTSFCDRDERPVGAVLADADAAMYEVKGRAVL